MDDQSMTQQPDRDALAARRHVQQIVTSDVVHKDRPQTVRLIEEGLELYGRDLVHTVAAFVAYFVADQVSEDVAEGRFTYLLTRCGDLLVLLAEQTGDTEHKVFEEFVAREYEFSGNFDDATRAVLEAAMRGAQASLVAHFFVRRGAPPWGIQSNLRLSDMCSVVRMLGYLLHAAIEAFPEEALKKVVTTLLADVRRILSVQASAAEMSVSGFVEMYFLDLATCEPL